MGAGTGEAQPGEQVFLGRHDGRAGAVHRDAGADATPFLPRRHRAVPELGDRLPAHPANASQRGALGAISANHQGDKNLEDGERVLRVRGLAIPHTQGGAGADGRPAALSLRKDQAKAKLNMIWVLETLLCVVNKCMMANFSDDADACRHRSKQPPRLLQ